MKRIITLLVLFISLSTFVVPTLSFSKMVTVGKDGVNLRSGPGQQYKRKWEYGKGFPLQITEKKGQWYRVKDFENDVGWIYAPLVKDIPYMVVKANKNKKGKINIRSGPGTKYEVVAQAYYGVVFKTIKQTKNWAKVEHDSGVTGWIKRSLLWGF